MWTDLLVEFFPMSKYKCDNYLLKYEAEMIKT